tara:strand:- start:187 stop:492 length:306 start_codon:yes stop_codon:yes gene_type:complete
MALHHNITGETNQELIAPNSNIDVSTISLVNLDSIMPCKVDLFIYSCSGTFYILKNTPLYAGEPYIYDKLSFSNSGDNSFGLYIKLTKTSDETPSVDVIIS